MSLQTELESAVVLTASDAQLLHRVIHGGTAETVTTEGGSLDSVAKLLNDANNRINTEADGILEQSIEAAALSEQFANQAGSEADRAEQAAIDGVTETQSILEQVQTSGAQTLQQADTTLQTILAKLLAVGLPDSLIGAAGQLLKVKTDETGYTLVNSAASPRFYGLAHSADGTELLLTEGREDYDTRLFQAWMISEGINFSIQRNQLVMQL
jgi:hypothetical protein